MENLLAKPLKTALKTKKAIRIGLIGCGSKGVDHLKALSSGGGVSLTSVADANQVSPSDIKNFERINFYTNYQKLLNNETLDAVVICLPHNLHYPVAVAALNKGLHILMEKPLALNLREAKELAELSQKMGKVFMVGTQRRIERSFSVAHELLPEVGRPFSFRYNYHISADLGNLGWRGLASSAGGGTIIDMGYHAIDTLAWYFGLPDSVFLYAGKLADPNSNSEVDDTALLSVSYNRPALGYIFLSRGISPEEEVLKISGDKGSLVVKRGQVQLYKKGLLDPVVELKDNKSKAEIYEEQLKIFLDSIEKNQTQACSISENILNMAVVEAAYLSRERNAPVSPQELLT